MEQDELLNWRGDLVIALTSLGCCVEKKAMMIWDFHNDLHLKLTQLKLSFFDGAPHLHIDWPKLQDSNAPSWLGSDKEQGKGLSSLGQRIIGSLNESGILIDVAHSSEQTMLDVASTSRYPVVYSHGGINHLHPSSRNITDRAIKEICDRGGVIGISFFPQHLGNSEVASAEKTSAFWAEFNSYTQGLRLSPEDLLRWETEMLLTKYPRPVSLPGLNLVFLHIDYVVQNYGDDYVAIGSDYDGIPYSCEGLEDISKLKNIANYMSNQGYSTTRVEKILGGNIQRVCREVAL